MIAIGERGFTLMELIVVMALLGILAWLSFPAMSGGDEVRLDAAARRLAADLRYAQGMAMGTRRMHGVLFIPAQNRYTVFAPTPATPVTDPADRARPLGVSYATRVEYSGVSITSASFGATPGVKFDYFGVPRDTLGTDLAATGRVILSCAGQSDTVDVAPQTGMVTVR